MSDTLLKGIMNALEKSSKTFWSTYMSKPIHYFLIFVCTVLISSPALAVSGSENDYIKALMNMKIFVPEDAADRMYLGIKEKSGQISLTHIKTQVLIIEVFSMYCPHCQRHAPVANKLYQAIDSEPQFRDKIKMIGIGVGNSKYEVGIFQDKYSPPFPLFDDRNSAVVNAFGGILTPHYFGLKMKDDSTFEVFYSRSGGYTDAEEFLEMIVKLSGIKLGGDQ
jgi:thiol-disulfide isomerase/thioredoxin